MHIVKPESDIAKPEYGIAKPKYGIAKLKSDNGESAKINESAV